MAGKVSIAIKTCDADRGVILELTLATPATHPIDHLGEAAEAVQTLIVPFLGRSVHLCRLPAVEVGD